MAASLARRLAAGAKVGSFPPAQLPASAHSRRRVAVSSTGEEEETVGSSSEGPVLLYGLKWALCGKGVIAKDKVFYNPKLPELQKTCHCSIEQVSGIPLYIRGLVSKGTRDISKAQYGRILKLVTTHLSSVSKLFVQDGSLGSSSKCNVLARMISDIPSSVISLSSILWNTPNRSISHDTCPLTIYVAGSISPAVKEVLGAAENMSNGFAAADVERSSVILCGKAFADSGIVKEALAALASPVLAARGGIPLSSRIVLLRESAIILFSPEEIVRSCQELRVLASGDARTVLSADGCSLLFQSKSMPRPHLRKAASVVFISQDSTGAMPLISKLSPGEAFTHFLAGYQDGRFVPAYDDKSLHPLEPLALAKLFLAQLKASGTPSFLINAKDGNSHISGSDLVKLVETSVDDQLPEAKPIGSACALRTKFAHYFSRIYKPHDLPKEFSL